MWGMSWNWGGGRWFWDIRHDGWQRGQNNEACAWVAMMLHERVREFVCVSVPKNVILYVLSLYTTPINNGD